MKTVIEIAGLAVLAVSLTALFGWGLKRQLTTNDGSQ